MFIASRQHILEQQIRITKRTAINNTGYGAAKQQRSGG